MTRVKMSLPAFLRRGWNRIPGEGVTERSLLMGVLLVLIWAPLPLGSNRLWSSNLLVMLIAALFFVWAALRMLRPIAQRSSALRVATPLLLMLGLAQVWVLLQLVLGISQDQGESLRYLMLGVSYSLFFVLLVALFDTRSRLKWLLFALVFSGAFQAFFGAMMTLSGVEWLLFQEKEAYRGVATGTFVNRNHLAGYLELTLAAGIGLLMALRDGKPMQWRSVLELLMGPKALIRLSLLIMVIALVLSHSRMGNAAFFSSLMIVGGLFILLSPKHRLRNSLILASLILIDLLVITQHFGFEGLKQRLERTQFEDQVQERIVRKAVRDEATGALVEREVVETYIARRENEQRDDINVYAWPMMLESLWVGHGAGSFESSFPRFPGPDVRSHYDHAHNDYLQFVIEYGVVGVIPLLGFVLLAFWHALRALRRRSSLFRSGLGMGATMGMLSLMIHSSTDFNLQIPANALTFVTLAAIAVLAVTHQNDASAEKAFSSASKSTASKKRRRRRTSHTNT
jgi:O-antigen ligase